LFRDKRGKSISNDHCTCNEEKVQNKGLWAFAHSPASVEENGRERKSKTDHVYKKKGRYWNFRNERRFKPMFLHNKGFSLFDVVGGSTESKLINQVFSLTTELNYVRAQLNSLQPCLALDAEEGKKPQEAFCCAHENPIDSILRQEFIENPSFVMHQTKLQMLQSKLEEKMLECKMQSKQIEELKIEAQKNSASLREVSELESKFQQCMESLAMAESQVSQASKCFERIESTELIVSDLEHTTTRLAQSLENADEKLDSKYQEVVIGIERLESTMESLHRCMLVEQETTCSQLEQFRASMIQQEASHAKEVEVLKSESKMNQSQLSNMLWELETYVNQCNTQEVALSHMQRQCVKLQAELSESLKDKAALKEQLKQMSEQLAEAQNRCSEMERDREQERMEIINYNQEIQNLGDMDDDDLSDVGEDVERSMAYFDSCCESSKRISHHDILAMFVSHGSNVAESMNHRIEACIVQSDETIKTLQSVAADSKAHALQDMKSSAATESSDSPTGDFVDVILRRMRKNGEIADDTLQVMDELQQQFFANEEKPSTKNGEPVVQDSSLEELVMEQVKELNRLMTMAKKAYETTSASESSDETLDTEVHDKDRATSPDRAKIIYM